VRQRGPTRGNIEHNQTGKLGTNRNATFGPNQNVNVQNRNANLKSTAVQKALNSRAMVGTLQNKAASLIRTPEPDWFAPRLRRGGLAAAAAETHGGGIAMADSAGSVRCSAARLLRHL
jgi:hypothetical protein